MSADTSTLNTDLAPSFRLVAWHMLLGVFGFVATAVVLLLMADQFNAHWFKPGLLGLVHSAALFWLLPIAMGALHQMVPVLFERRVYSEKIAWSALVLNVLGGSSLIAHMFTLNNSVGLMATGMMTALGVLLWVANLLLTIKSAGRPNLIGGHVVIALAFLATTAVIGGMLAWNLWEPYLNWDHLRWLRGHAHLGIYGFFGILIMGVGYKLAEMFLLSYGADMRLGRWALISATIGLLVLVATLMFSYSAPVVGAILLGLSACLFVSQFGRILRKRLKRQLDVPWRHTLATLAWLLMATGLGLGLVFDLVPQMGVVQVSTIYIFVGLFGFVGSVVSGQMFKIMPFLVWLKWYSPHLGLRQIPPATELISRHLMLVQFVLQQSGVALIVVGVLSKTPRLQTVGAWSFLCATIVFAIMMIKLMRSRPIDVAN